ncbi:hypothetical protein ABZY31_28835 [Streptomyces sp. NPDC006529]|uniref:hypothetical protein n=1 Tax=Streptomyces sp. NPDC006529 TaxID=3157177 RepID=UPI0033AA7FBB
MANRFWCGECTFKTPWVDEPEGLRRQIEHYARKHPGTTPGGQVETRRGGRPGPRTAGLLLAGGVLVAAAVVAAWPR